MYFSGKILVCLIFCEHDIKDEAGSYIGTDAVHLRSHCDYYIIP